MKSMLLAIAVIFSLTAIGIAAFSQPLERPIAVLGPTPPATTTADVQPVIAALKSAGLKVDVLTPQQLADAGQFNTERYSLLVLSNAAYFPAAALSNTLQFLSHKGKLICVGGPAFQNDIYSADGKWQTLANLVKSVPKLHNILDLSTAQPEHWGQAKDNPNTSIAVTVTGSPHGPALHFEITNYNNWLNVQVPAFTQSPFTNGADIVTFWAKGDANTTGITLEWREEDGSRWIAGIPITSHWRRYVIPCRDFRFWRDGSPADRGGPGDFFHPERAHLLYIGLAQSHVPVPPGNKQLWIADLGVAKLPIPTSEVQPPVLESLSPWYKIYIKNGEVHPIERYRGLGLTGLRPGLLTMRDGGRDWTYLNLTEPYAGAAWAEFNPPPADSESGWRRLGDLAHSMLNGLYLTKFGSDQFCYQPGQTVTLGADVTNAGSNDETVRLLIALRREGSNAVLAQHESSFTVAAGSTRSVRFHWTAGPSAEYRIHAELTQGSHLSAAGEQPLRVMAIPHDPASDMVKVVGDEFILKGKPWRPVGINFWPLMVSGQQRSEYWSGWLSPNVYDPVLVERDLALCQKLHINEVSIQYLDASWAPSLNDFLARCHAHHTKANVFLPGLNALSQNVSQAISLIKAAHLAGNDTVFAYDIAWEPTVGNHNQRKRLDGDWRQWLRDQYGSIRSAERNWKYILPVENGKPTNPLDSQLESNGPWFRMVDAYRRFIGDEISKGYQQSEAAIRSVDPHHLIGARSGYGGNGSPWVNGVMAYDLLWGAKHLSFISPEGYALSGTWDQVRWGGLTTAYARWAGNGKPVFWAEFGHRVYPNTSPELIAEQGQYYQMIYRMVMDSGANGAAGWWFPGGLRIDENSDFGIISPDGMPRPAALELQHYEPLIAEMHIPTKPTAVITINRDADSRGYAAVWAKWRDEYDKLREEGKVVAVRTTGSGTTTADMPLTALGDVPADGHNPLLFANAEFNWIKTQSAGEGKLKVTASIGNTGEAKWLPTGTGRVALLIWTDDPDHQKVVPIGKSVPRYGNITVGPFELNFTVGSTIHFRMAVLGRTLPSKSTPAIIPFGEMNRKKP